MSPEAWVTQWVNREIGRDNICHRLVAVVWDHYSQSTSIWMQDAIVHSQLLSHQSSILSDLAAIGVVDHFFFRFVFFSLSDRVVVSKTLCVATPSPVAPQKPTRSASPPPLHTQRECTHGCGCRHRTQRTHRASASTRSDVCVGTLRRTQCASRAFSCSAGNNALLLLAALQSNLLLCLGRPATSLND